MPTPTVQTRQRGDEDEPRLGEGDRRAHHRCAAILRHLLKYRPDIAFAVHEVSKTFASPGDADLRRLRRIGRNLLETQKLGIMIRKSNDPGHLDAYTAADWSGVSSKRKSTPGGTLKIGSATLRRVHKRSELSHVIERRERIPRCGDDDGRDIASPTTPGILGNPRLLWLQAKHEERKLTVIKEPTQTNTADGFTEAVQAAKYLEWRNRLNMGSDNGEDVETSKGESLPESRRWAQVEALHAIPRSVLIATLMQ